MDIKSLSEAVSVAPQVNPADVPAIASLGFRSLICNRPDGEGEDQPAAAEVAAAARAAGMDFAFVPAIPGALTGADAIRPGACPSQK
ncbi:MAG: hypothetical protein EON94_14530 [Caulobacteraceae bacterium]|nr:MAG: hypothetical protein EON94_14530 [Caulobacteraceae bacterium]